MSYIGSTPTTQSFISGTDYFNGNGSTTAFTLSRTVASVNDIQAVVNNVVQVPNDAYNISGNTITFTSAPSSGTGNVYVRYLSTTTQSITPSQNTVSYATWDNDLRNETFAFKNRIINGDMTIAQRGTGSITVDTSDQFPVDRFKVNGSSSGKLTSQQNAGSVTPPAGFVNYLGCTSSSAYSIPSGEAYSINQAIEGLNVADLGWGTVNASTVTLSFWVRSSLTGTFGGVVKNASGNRSYPISYVINAANTWEKKSITIPGDTTGTWLTTNGVGVLVVFSMGAGSSLLASAGAWTATSNIFGATGQTNLVATNGATFYITGVQLEKGTTATNFDVLPYGTELQLCQRYYEKTFNIGTAPSNGQADADRKQGIAWASGNIGYYTRFEVPKRAAPTLTLFNGSPGGTAGQWTYFGGSVWTSVTVGGSTILETEFSIDFNASGRTFGQALILAGHWTANAEL